MAQTETRDDTDTAFSQAKEQRAPQLPIVPPTSNGLAAAPYVYQQPTGAAAGFVNIAKAIASVMAELEPVVKEGENKFHNYKYAKLGDILLILTPLMGKHGIVIFQDEIERSMFDNDNVIAIKYRFEIAHSSGETWPRALHQTGVSRCRDSKGGWDDKSLNKCHSAARKYFLLALFQVPTEDEDDHEADRGKNSRPSAAEPEPPREPVELTVEKGGAKAWTRLFLAALRQADSRALLEKWIKANESMLERLEKADANLSAACWEAVGRRRAELPIDAPPGGSKPLPPLVNTVKPAGEPMEKPAPQKRTKAKADDAKAPEAAPATTAPLENPDDGSIPDYLKRRVQQKMMATTDDVFDGADWLKQLKGAFEGCEDLVSLGQEQARLMQPEKGRALPPDWAKAVALYSAAFERLTAS